MTTPNLIEELDWLSNESSLFGGPENGSPFYAAMTPGAPRLAVLVGDNASGKSLLVRVLSAGLREKDAMAVSVSIRERTGAGLGEMARMAQAFMFGDEGDQSTGATSIQVVQNALENNLDRKDGCLLILDEPEMGLAEGYSHALGQYIAQQSKTMPRKCGGVIVVTHSRALVRGVKAGLGRNPTFVVTGTAPVEKPSVSKWLARTDEYDIETLLALPTVKDFLKPKK
jgi:hypothetical protein